MRNKHLKHKVKFVRMFKNRGLSDDHVKAALLFRNYSDEEADLLIKRYYREKAVDYIFAFMLVIVAGLFVFTRADITGRFTAGSYVNRTLVMGESYEGDMIIPLEISGEIHGLYVEGRIEEGVDAELYLVNDVEEIGLDYLRKESGIKEPEQPSRENDGSVDINLNVSSYLERKDKVIGVSVAGSLVEREEKLCTKYGIYSAESHEVCYGDDECCDFLGLSSEGYEWNDTLYLNVGKYGISDDVNVSGQIVFANYSLDVEDAYSEILYSSEQQANLRFYGMNGFIAYYTDNLELDDASLRIETNGRLIIDDIVYTVKRETNNAPVFEEIPNVTIVRGEPYVIDLREYVSDEDNDSLRFGCFGLEGIEIDFIGMNAVIIAEDNFTGRAFTFFTANDSMFTAVSNIFAISVEENVSVVKVKPKVKVGEAVRWVERKNVSEGKVSLEHEPINVSVKISEREVDDSNVRIKVKGVTKYLDEFEREKRGEVVAAAKSGAIGMMEEEEEGIELMIEEEADEVEVEYYTEGPSAAEENVSKFRKKVTISSEIHYADILAFTAIEDKPLNAIKLYRTTDGVREEVSFSGFDMNNNSLIDYIEWIVPHLSNETYEVEITVLNVQSYPTVGGVWEVRFNTTGRANLSISAVNGTSYTEIYDNSSSEDDLVFLEVKCDDDVLNASVVLSDGTIVPYDVYLKVKRVREIDEVLGNG